MGSCHVIEMRKADKKQGSGVWQRIVRPVQECVERIHTNSPIG